MSDTVVLIGVAIVAIGRSRRSTRSRDALHRFSTRRTHNALMKRYMQFASAATALSFSLIGVANAQTSTSFPDSTKGMQGTNGMQNMRGGRMMSMMKGDDPVAACSSMMKKIAADPKVHKEMSSIMRSQMSDAR